MPCARPPRGPSGARRRAAAPSHTTRSGGWKSPPRVPRPVVPSTSDGNRGPTLDLSAAGVARRLENQRPRGRPLTAATHEPACQDCSYDLMIDPMATGTVKRPPTDPRRSRGREALSTQPPGLTPDRPEPRTTGREHIGATCSTTWSSADSSTQQMTPCAPPSTMRQPLFGFTRETAPEWRTWLNQELFMRNASPIDDGRGNGQGPTPTAFARTGGG